MINAKMKDIGSVLEQGHLKEAFDRIIYMNTVLQSICDNYKSRHNINSGVFDVNLTNSLNLRNLLLYNALFVVGPFIFEDESVIFWESFSSQLDISEEVLKSSYKGINGFFSNDVISSIVKTSFATGFIEDFEITGVVYSISYFIQFILKVEASSLPFSDCVSLFYSSLSSYSYPLLITSVISIQQNVGVMVSLGHRTRNEKIGSFKESVG